MVKKGNITLEWALYMQANYAVESNYETDFDESEWFTPGPLYEVLGFVALRRCKYDKHKIDGKKEDGSIVYGIYPSKISFCSAEDVLQDKQSLKGNKNG